MDGAFDIFAPLKLAFDTAFAKIAEISGSQKFQGLQ
jgi:hypothetical protein